ncbi:MAG TPA: rhodanese-like domain-containing protein [Candidatus Angelobacter sp.]|nr:rhodanese-like domain-containing protein [Candidatus Angelobacter sp.]
MSMPAFKKLVDEIKSEVQQIDPEEFQRMRQAGEDFDIIDVREKEESEEGTIPGAVSLPRGILEAQIDEVTTDFDRKIVCYCDGGSRSVLAVYMLKRMGFKNASSLMGGYRAWIARNR